MQSSKMSLILQMLILRYSQAKGKFLLFSNVLENPLTGCVSGTNLSLFMQFPAKCYIRNTSYNYVEN